MIEVKNLVKKYGNHIAVQDLNFTVEKGQVYGFLGPNGAGKSTTMNIITGYIGATQGEVLIDGIDIVTNPKEAKRHIGYLPEQPPLYADMTVGEYLNFAARIKGISKREIEQNIQSVCSTTQIEDVGRRIIRNLSKGYKQRVGLAQALLGYPEILIFDEPTVGLDPKQIIEIRDLIKSLGKKHTVILSSHILSEVSAICDQVLIISKGRLVANDTPQKLTEMMKNKTLIALTVKGAPDSIKNALKRIPECAFMKIESAEEHMAFDVCIELEGKSDIREELFYALSDARLPILSMSYNKATLEDVFLQLTQDKDAQEGKPAEEEGKPAEEANRHSSGPEAGGQTTAIEKEGKDNAGDL